MTTTKASSAAAGAADDTDETDDAAELKRLRAENARLRRKQAEPEPAADAEPAPLTHVLALACGHTVLSPNPHPSHHSCDDHGTVPVTGVWDRPADDETDQAA